MTVREAVKTFLHVWDDLLSQRSQSPIVWSRLIQERNEAIDVMRKSLEADTVEVPREPTQAMFLAAEAAGVSFATQQKCWSAMIAAAPSQSEQPT